MSPWEVILFLVPFDVENSVMVAGGRGRVEDVDAETKASFKVVISDADPTGGISDQSRETRKTLHRKLKKSEKITTNLKNIDINIYVLHVKNIQSLVKLFSLKSESKDRMVIIKKSSE